MAQARVVALLLALSTLLVVSSATKWPIAPPDAVVAVAKLTPVKGKESAGTGTATLIFRRPDKGNGTVSITLNGKMDNITMAHIHLANATVNNPIRLGLLPRTLTPALLDPPLNYKGAFSFVTPFDSSRIIAWGSPSAEDFLVKLMNGQLYVNVHTVANPGGEVQGTFVCKDPCMWPVCSAGPGKPPC